MKTLLLFLCLFLNSAVPSAQEALGIMPDPPVEGEKLTIVGQSSLPVIEVRAYICYEQVGEAGFAVGGKIRHTITVPENTVGLEITIEMVAQDPNNPEVFTEMSITRTIEMSD